mgnify:CR=1 FL=1
MNFGACVGFQVRICLSAHVHAGKGIDAGLGDIGARIDLGRNINGGVAPRPEHEAIGRRRGRRIRQCDEGQAVFVPRRIPSTCWFDDPEIGEAREFLAACRSRADGERARRAALREAARAHQRPGAPRLDRAQLEHVREVRREERRLLVSGCHGAEMREAAPGLTPGPEE